MQYHDGRALIQDVCEATRPLRVSKVALMRFSVDVTPTSVASIDFILIHTSRSIFSLRSDASILSRSLVALLISQFSIRGGMARPMHQFGRSRTGGGSQRETRVSQIVKMKIVTSDRHSGTCPCAL
jgi:hypothetical protein